MSQDTNFPKVNGLFFTLVFEEIEGKVTKRTSHEFIRTKRRDLDAICKVDECFLNSHVSVQPLAAPETSWIWDCENNQRNEDRFRKDTPAEVRTWFKKCPRSEISVSDRVLQTSMRK